MKKRLIFVSSLLAASLILSPVLTASLHAEESSGKENTSVSSEEESKSEVEVSSSEESTEASSEKSSESSVAEENDSNAKPEIKEAVLYDENDIKLTAKSLELNEQKGLLQLDLLIENNSKEDLKFKVRNANVNRVGVDTYIDESLSAGKKSKVKMEIRDDYKIVDLSKTAIIDFVLSVIKGDDTPYIENTPLEIKTNLFKENATFLPKPVYDKDQLKIYSLGLVETKYDKGLVLVFENDSDKTYTINSEEAYINGFSLSQMYAYSDVPAKSFTTVLARMNDKSFDEADIKSMDEIENFEFKFSTIENNNYDTKKVTDMIEIKLKGGETATEEAESKESESQSETEAESESKTEAETTK